VDFINVNGWSVKTGKLQAFQDFFVANREKIAAAAPDGCEYIGTYAVVFTSEKEAGQAWDLWRLESYGALDALAEAGRSGPLADLFAEAMQFVDYDSDSWCKVLLKSFADATVYDASEG
jgi:hypothetical protein